MFPNEYQSAFEKISASEEWKAQTLQKMQTAQTMPKKKPLAFVRPVAGVCAAALVLLVVPAVWIGGRSNKALTGSANDTAMPQATQYNTEESVRMADEGAAQESAMSNVTPVAMGELIVQSADQIATENPTVNQPIAALPTALPLYQTKTGFETLQETVLLYAQRLSDTILEWVYEELYTPAQLYAYGEEYSYTTDGATLWVTDKNFDALVAAPAAQAAPDALCMAQYEEFAAKVAPLKKPAAEILCDYSIYKTPVYTNTVYSAVDGTLEEKLYAYSFKRVNLGIDETGNLMNVAVTLEPTVDKTVSIISADTALAQLRAGQGQSNGGVVGEYAHDGEILQTELLYSVGKDGVWQPVYRFTVRSNADAGQTYFSDYKADGYEVYTWVYVQAAQDAGLAYQKQFN